MFKSNIERNLPTVIKSNPTLGNFEVRMQFSGGWDVVKIGTLTECQEWQRQNKLNTTVQEEVVKPVGNFVYAIERECRYCGAPMGVYEVTKDQFDSTTGPSYDDFSNHHEYEHSVREGDRLVKMIYGTCFSCRGRDR